jgi:hypothetical protein
MVDGRKTAGRGAAAKWVANRGIVERVAERARHERVAKRNGKRA